MDSLSIRTSYWNKKLVLDKIKLTLTGYSRAAYRTGFYIPELGIMLDAGPQNFNKPSHIFITHAHADHARIGHRNYLVHKDSVNLIRHQIGNYLDCQAVDYGETIYKNGVKISLHPAGHIPGSAQVRIEYKGEVWVFSGDIKLSPDGMSTEYESIKCHALVSEGTFGLPLFNWEDQNIVFDSINNWWANNKSNNKTSVLVCDAIGKAQRVLRNLDPSIGGLVAHRSIYNINKVFNKQGISVPDTKRLELTKNQDFNNSLVFIPQNIVNTPWMKNIDNCSLGIVSAWMSLKEERRKNAIRVRWCTKQKPTYHVT
jgi:putative mRNA 3-end processing factor